MPPEHDLDPGVYTEKERLARRQEQASMAFEMDHPPVLRSRVARFHYGTTEHTGGGPTGFFGSAAKRSLAEYRLGNKLNALRKMKES